MGYNLAETVRQQLQRQAAPEETTRDIEAITAEIIRLQQDAGNAIIGIGKRLIEAETMLPHGEWLPWLAERVGYSERVAQSFMRLAREWESNPKALSDLGATKALKLLVLPPEERETFMAKKHLVDGEEKSVIDMTSRELDKAIRERDEARKLAESAQAEARTAEESRARMEADMSALKEMHRSALDEAERAVLDLLAAQKELKALQERPVDVAVETVVDQEVIEKARAEAIAEMRAKVDAAEKARKEAEKKLKAAEGSLKDARKQAGDNAAAMARAEKAEAELAEARRQLDAAAKEAKRARMNADPDLALFNLLFGQVQEQINKLHGLMLKIGGRDEAAADRLSDALLALARPM